MVNLGKSHKSMLRGVVGGIILGIPQGFDISPSFDNPIKAPLEIIIPIGLIAPPILFLIQLPLFRRGKPKWFFSIHRHFNILFFLSFMALSISFTGLFRLGSIEPNNGRDICLFFGAAGIGFLLTAIMEQRKNT